MKLVGKVDDVGGEGSGDDGEDHVRHREHGRESEQLHVLNKNRSRVCKIVSNVE